MDQIKLNDKLKHLEKIAEISKVIIAKITAMPDLPDLKLDLDIILYICTIIENEIKQNQVKSIDKKSLVVSILSKIHPHTAIELSLLNKQIEFLHSNKLINKITKLEKTGSQIFNWALKKIA